MASRALVEALQAPPEASATLTSSDVEPPMVLAQEPRKKNGRAKKAVRVRFMAGWGKGENADYG
jgi:hypothetical protein